MAGEHGMGNDMQNNMQNDMQYTIIVTKEVDKPLAARLFPESIGF